MATRMQQRRGTAAQWTAADPVLGAGEIGFETDTGKFKMGDGTSSWTELYYFLDSNDLDLGGSLDDYVPLTQKGANNGVATLDSAGKVPLTQLGNIIDGAPEALNTLNELAAAISDDPDFYTNITDITSDIADLNTSYGDLFTSLGTVTSAVSDLTTDLGTAETNITTLTNDLNTLETTVSGVQGSLATAETDIDNLQSDVSGLETTTGNLETEKAPKASPTFTGTVVLPSTTSIGDVSNTEISYLNGVTSDIQTQIDGKLASSTASSTYAPLSGPTFTGTVTLPSTTSIGSVSDTELGYLNGVTSGIQTQIDGKAASSHTHAQSDITNLTTDLAAKAPLNSPTFTGTVSGITATMVGLGNVDNTSDANKPVSTATQTALDAKLNLAGGTMTGALTLSGAPTDSLHAATKAYVDGVSEGLHVHQSAVAATTANIDLSTALENGDVLDGVTLATGNRVLVKNQTTKSQNGIYVVQASGAAVRATDFDAPAEIDGGDFIFITGGTVNDNTGWVQTNIVGTVGTDDIEFSQFSGAGTYLAGNGLTLTGNTFSINTSTTVDTGTAQTLTNKTIALGSNTVSGTLAQFNAAVTDADLAPVASPTFTGTVTVSASGIAFSDGTQTKEGVPSRTPITQVTAAYNLSTGGLSLRDGLVEVSHTGGSAVTVTIPADSTTDFPVGTSIDVLRTNTGGVTIAGAAGVTVNATPGLSLRAQWSSVTLFKRAANTWVAFGDLAS